MACLALPRTARPPPPCGRRPAPPDGVRPMIGPWSATAADGANYRFCERCGGPARPEGSIDRGGLRTCGACGIHACVRCWARSAGTCPACGVAVAGTSVVHTVGPATRTRPPAPPPAPARAPERAPQVLTPGRRRRPRRLGVVAAAAAAASIGIAVAGSFLGQSIRPSGGVAGVVGTPGRSAESSIAGVDLPSASAGGAGDATSRPPGGTNQGTGPDVAGEPGSTGPIAGPTPTATPRAQPSGPPPTPAPTRAPTPPPTPPPTPDPTPCRLAAPDLIGAHRNDASQIWADAGFSGAVTALGHGNYLIASQTPAAGADLPCDAGVTIGPASG